MLKRSFSKNLNGTIKILSYKVRVNSFKGIPNIVWHNDDAI